MVEKHVYYLHYEKVKLYNCAGAVQRWILAQPQRAAVTRKCEEMAGYNSDMRSPKDLDPSRMMADEVSIQGIMQCVESMVNPFQDSSDELLCLSSGLVATEEIKSDLLQAERLGEKAAATYMQERLLSKNTDMFKPIKAMKLGLIGDRQKSSKTQTSKTIMLKNDRNLFSRLLVLSQARNIELTEILKYSLGPISYPLAGSDGSMCKTTKSTLLKVIEEEFPNGEHLVDKPPSDGALMIDAMALIQCVRVSAIPATFGELAMYILSKILSLADFYTCGRVDFVADTYPITSIKECERGKRAASGQQLVKIFNDGQKAPTQWKKYLNHGQNKEALIEYLFNRWKRVVLPRNLTLFVAHGALCHSLSFSPGEEAVVEIVDQLCSDHEEADTKLLLHAKHASQTHGCVLIKTPDTDVVIIAISLAHHLSCDIYLLTLKCISITAITDRLSQLLAMSLIGLHAFTGCDSVSAFYGKGKRSVYTLLRPQSRMLDGLRKLGKSSSPYVFDTELLPVMESIVCLMYGCPDTTEVNTARYKLFCSKASTEQSLPPTQDALIQHLRRACYQATVWERALEAKQNAPSPVGHGWSMVEDNLQFSWMTSPPSPVDVLQTTYCKCQKSQCQGGRCSCVKSKLRCTDLCGCTNCTNKTLLADGSDTDDNDSDEVHIRSPSDSNIKFIPLAYCF